MNCGWNRWMCMIWSTRTSRQSGFFLKISLRLLTSLTCETRKPHIPMWGCKRREKKTQFALHFQPCSWPFVDCSCILEYAKMWTVLQSMTSIIDSTTGECWAGHSGQHDHTQYGLDYDGCIEDDYQPCTANSRYCVGKHFSNMVFQIGMFYFLFPYVCMFGVLSGLISKNLLQKAKC